MLIPFRSYLLGFFKQDLQRQIKCPITSIPRMTSSILGNNTIQLFFVDAPAVNLTPVENPDDTTEIFRQPDDEVERNRKLTVLFPPVLCLTYCFA